jgi:DNA-binding NarL/FixJ family response regulator
MENLGSKTQREILKTIEIANATLDPIQIRRRIQETLSRSIYIESSGFIPTYENSNNFNLQDILLQNLDTSLLTALRKHFFRLDPFKAIRKSYSQREIVRLEELVDFRSFLSTEYYNDFLKPQKIFHKIVVNLANRGRLFATICLHRPQGAKNFSEMEIRILKAMVPYLTYALEFNELRRAVATKDNLLDIVTESCSSICIILNDAMKPIYINQGAIEFCKSQLDSSYPMDIDGGIPPILLEDCHQIIKELRKGSLNGLPVMPKKRVIKGIGLKKYVIYSRLIEEERSSSPKPWLIMVNVEKISGSTGIDLYALKEQYNLTDREIEIALNVFRGLRNAEIAEKLYVSEITVKWHLQNIFQKMDVKNRTALAHKMIAHVQGGYRFGIY